MPSWKDLQTLATSGLTKASRETQRQLNLARLKLMANDLTTRKEKAFERLGEAVYGDAKTGQLAEEEFERWATLLNEIRIIEEEMAAVERDMKRIAEGGDVEPHCPACGRVVSLGSNFCPICGAAIDQPA